MGAQFVILIMRLTLTTSRVAASITSAGAGLPPSRPYTLTIVDGSLAVLEERGGVELQGSCVVGT